MMTENGANSGKAAATVPGTSWYAPGETKTFLVGDEIVAVRFVGRKGRRGRIAIERVHIGHANSEDSTRRPRRI